MDVFPLLISMFVLPGAEALAPVDVLTDGEMVAYDQQLGDGREIQAGEVATVHYTLGQEQGKGLADSRKRGLPYSLSLENPGEVSPIAESLQRMRLGGTRILLVPSSRLGESDGNLLPPKSDLVLVVELVALGRPRGPKVDSGDVGRAEGAVEIPRAPVGHGPTRSQNPL